MDLRTWSLPRMFNAYESAISQNAKDESERAMIHAKLYAPPREHVQRKRAEQRKGSSPQPAAPSAPQAGGFDLTRARSLMAVIQAENAKLGIDG